MKSNTKLSPEIKELLESIQDWMLDNDYAYDPTGAEIYNSIKKLLSSGEQQENASSGEEEECLDLEECDQCGEAAWDGRICHSCGMKII